MNKLALFDQRIVLIQDPELQGADALYKLLGLTRDASTADIKDRYRHLSKQTHSDRGGDDGLQGRLNEAKRILLDEAPSGVKGSRSFREIYDNKRIATELFGAGLEHNGQTTTSFAEIIERGILWDRKIADVQDQTEYQEIKSRLDSAVEELKGIKFKFDYGLVRDQFTAQRLQSEYKTAVDTAKQAQEAAFQYLFSTLHPEGEEIKDQQKQDFIEKVNHNAERFNYETTAQSKMFDLFTEYASFVFATDEELSVSIENLTEDQHIVRAHLNDKRTQHFPNLKYLDLKSYDARVDINNPDLTGRIALVNGRVTIHHQADSPVAYRIIAPEIQAPGFKKQGDLYVASADVDLSTVKPQLEIILNQGYVKFQQG